MKSEEKVYWLREVVMCICESQGLEMFLGNDSSFAWVWVRGVSLNFSFAVVTKILQYQQRFFSLPCIQEATTPTSPDVKFWVYTTLYCKVHAKTQALCAITLEQGWCPFSCLISHNYQKKPPTPRCHKPQPGLRSVLCLKEFKRRFLTCRIISPCKGWGTSQTFSFFWDIQLYRKI